MFPPLRRRSSRVQASSVTEHNTTKEVLNRLRVLQRVFPLTFGLGSEPVRFQKGGLAEDWVINSLAPVGQATGCAVYEEERKRG